MLKDIILNATIDIYIYLNGIRKQNADSTNNLRVPLTRCGFCLQLRNPQQLNLNTQLSYYLFVDSTNCLELSNYGCGFCKIAYFWCNFERYSVLGNCLWNPKKRKRSKKSSKVAESRTNLILVCCGIRLYCTECTGWPRNDITIEFTPIPDCEFLSYYY